MAFLEPYMLFIAISFLVSLLVYFRKELFYTYLRFFPPFLLLTLLVELIASYRAYSGKHNIVLYNFFSVSWICFYLLIISLIISRASVKKIIWVTTAVYTLAALINILFIQKIETLNTVTYSLGCLLIVVFCMYYFFELFRFPKSVNLKNNPAFWICSGLLFFCCCGFPLYGFINFWATIPFIVKSFKYIVAILNIFLYSLFTIAFLCVRTRKYTS